MRKILIKVLNIIRAPKLLYKKNLFKKNATFKGNIEDVRIGITAFCQNMTKCRDNIVIGKCCDIDARICANGKNSYIEIGDYTTIRYRSVIGAIEKIIIGSYVIISNNVTIYDNNNHPTDPEIRKKMCKTGFYTDMWNWENSSHKPVVIKDNVWIGEGSTILKGVTIGEGAVVGCKSVVTKDVEPYTVVAGNPARCVKHLK